MTPHLFPGSTPCCQNPVGTHLLAMLKPCVQAGLDYSQHLQIFVPMLCEGLPGASGHLVSLRGQEFSAQSSADLTVASLGALREYILFRCAPKPAISHICLIGRFLCVDKYILFSPSLNALRLPLSDRALGHIFA